MDNQTQKYSMIQSLSESEFRRDVLIPLLKKMGYQKVRERHGSQEYGKDITFFESSEFGGMHYAVVAKVGNISGSASGKQNLDIVKAQIDQAFTMPFDDVEDKEKYHIDRVIVWTTGNISNNAEKQIVNLADARYKYVIFRGDEATVELLERFYPTFFTIRDVVVSDYYNAVKNHYSRLEELRTLGANDEHRKLPVIFVPPTFSEYIPRKIEKNEVKAKLERFTLTALQNMLGNIVLVGDAGSGKTTLLRKLFLGIVEQNELEAKREPIPVLVKLKQLDSSIEDPIVKMLQNELIRFSPDGSWDEIVEDLKSGNVTVFFDGLDELENKDSIDKAIQHIKNFASLYPKVKIVLTSRYLPELEQPGVLPNFRIFRINDLEPMQMVKFIENWYGDNTEICRKLVKVISNPTSLRGLPATPLTLAIVAILHERSPWQEVPANQTELFSKYIELALGRWDASKDISVQFEYSVKKFLLQQISWDIHQRNEFEISMLDFDAWITLLAEGHGLTIDIGIFKKEVIERSELLFRNDRGNYEFKHRSFQDFFVGAEINRQPHAIEIVKSKHFDSWWSPAIFFAGGLQPDNERYIDAILGDAIPDRSKALFFAVSLGELVQATFMATKQTKTRVIRLVLDELVESWKHTYEFWINIEKKPFIVKDIPPHILFLAVHMSAAQAALGSVTLSPVLSEIANEYVNVSKNSQNVLERELAILEWKAFLLAAACAQCDSNVEDFLRLYQSRLITDPGFLFFGRMLAKEISERSWLNTEITEMANKLYKRLDKKWQESTEYRKYLNKVEIIALPDSKSA